MAGAESRVCILHPSVREKHRVQQSRVNESPCSPLSTSNKREGKTKAASKTGVAEQKEIELAAPRHSGRVLEGAKKSTIILKERIKGQFALQSHQNYKRKVQLSLLPPCRPLKSELPEPSLLPILNFS